MRSSSARIWRRRSSALASSTGPAAAGCSRSSRGSCAGCPSSRWWVPAAGTSGGRAAPDAESRRMSAPARLRIAVVGAGRMGMVHGHLLQIHPETELVAFVDRDTGLAAHLASQGLRAKLYPSLEEAYAE